MDTVHVVLSVASLILGLWRVIKAAFEDDYEKKNYNLLWAILFLMPLTGGSQ